MRWELSIGALPDAAGTRFRVWAPDAHVVEVLLHTPARQGVFMLTPEPDGYFAGHIAGIGPGDRYSYRLDGGDPRPDPASRSQPEGVHGPSEVIDPGAFVWSDELWRGLPLEDLVFYELHVGTATAEGSFDALIAKLDQLKDLGVSAIELMPVADWPGSHNWGYDGVNLFAPARAYGGAEGMRRLVDAAHALGLAVFLDVVYNHLGPDGNYLWVFSRDYFTSRHKTPWGDALNFDGPGSRPVRDFFIGNALHWAHEYHLDGLRLDATDMIVDDSPTHIICELAATIRASLPQGRTFEVIAENASNDPAVVRPAALGGWGCDGVWADDFHHQVRVALTGERDGYYRDFGGSALDLARTINQGWFYIGQESAHWRGRRGQPAGAIAPPHFVYCIQNHDQVGNRALGERLNHDVELDAFRAASALLLLCPHTPLIWMGQEWAASTPFLFFTDHHPELGRLVTEGRRKEFAGFSTFSAEDVPDPQAEASFVRSKLRWEERDLAPHRGVLQLYTDLLALRRAHPALRERGIGTFTAAPVGERILMLRRGSPGGEQILAAVSLGGSGLIELAHFPDLVRGIVDWEVRLDSEDARYGGRGAGALTGGALSFDGPRAVVLRQRS
ncbi:MAG: malto-oligosyltrehalose trehalohydrolase [Chloroflexales bacterium]|nr:malto-oligosyltrehalose trehalohydrolase [Chloroflexales bacterium]